MVADLIRSYGQRRAILPRSLQRPLASTEGSAREKINKSGVGSRPLLSRGIRGGSLRCAGGPNRCWSTQRDQIGIGTAVTRRPLPHHRAYGSVHGGSSRLRYAPSINRGRPSESK